MSAAKNVRGRRAPVRAQNSVPVLPVVVGVLLLAVFVGLLIYGVINNRSTSVPTVTGSTGSIPCDALEHTQVHYHVGLQIVDNGTLHPIPSGIGIQGAETAPSCYYWLHVHAASGNTVHIESPADRTFTLGDFFKVWDAWSSYNGNGHVALTSSEIATLPVGTGQDVKVYVDLGDGKGPQLQTGDPSKIVLRSHEVITIVIGPPDLQPSDGRFPTFTWSNGL